MRGDGRRRPGGRCCCRYDSGSLPLAKEEKSVRGVILPPPMSGHTLDLAGGREEREGGNLFLLPQTFCVRPAIPDFRYWKKEEEEERVPKVTDCLFGISRYNKF